MFSKFLKSPIYIQFADLDQLYGVYLIKILRLSYSWDTKQITAAILLLFGNLKKATLSIFSWLKVIIKIVFNCFCWLIN